MILKNDYLRLLTLSFLTSVVMILSVSSLAHADTTCNCAVFTMDGVQDYFLTNVQMDIIKMFEQKGANLTIGVIGNDFGTDPNMTNFIQNQISHGNNKSIIEVANNGWKGEDFIDLSENQQSELIKRTQARLNYLLKTDALTFIAPYGNMNNDTMDALRDGDLRFAIGYWNTTDVPMRHNETGIYIIPPSISSGELNPVTNLYDPTPYDELLQGIHQNVTDNGVSVVSMQPLEFAQRNQTDYVNESNEDQIEKLGTLLDALKSNNIPTVTITELARTIN